MIQSLALTIGADAGLMRQLDSFRKKRNLGGYERAGTVSDHEANEMMILAELIRRKVRDWLESHRPDLFQSQERVPG